MQRIETEEQFQANDALCTALYRHMTCCPPHGPYARLAAITFVDLARDAFDVVVSPALVLHLLKATWTVDHMRAYAPLYVAADISLVDVEKLRVIKVESPAS